MGWLRTALSLLATASPLAHALYINGSIIAPCASPIYCHGDLLKEIELAQPFSDSKTFVDMPTTRPLEEVIAAFDKLSRPVSNNTELTDFLSTYFAPAGGELQEVARDLLTTDPVFLDKIDDIVIKEFVQKVINIWPDLTRSYAGENCTECESSFIPVKRTFVIAGGRFREPYYWDSYWILEGLLRTGGSFTEIAKNTIENFLDLIEQIGFIPNGARIYYENRSQPPLLSQMIRIYLQHTNDTAILDRAVPLLIEEHEFWMSNRTVDITKDGKTHKLNRYAVMNNQPRPESYREDFISATNSSYYSASGIIYPETAPLNDTEKASLYANLASGAESGWDYGTRFIARPNDAAKDVYFPIRSLNTRNIVPVDLNSILYANELAIASFLNQTGKSSEARWWEQSAKNRSEAMHAVMWNSSLWSYFDYNITSSEQDILIPADEDALEVDKETAPGGQQVLFHIAQLYPFWTGAAPSYLKNNPLAVQKAYRKVSKYLDAKAGAIPATNFKSGQQWDEPNVWPPLIHIIMDGLLNTPPTFGTDDPAYVEVQRLALEVGQRYLDSTFCTWHATGGSTSETPQLEGLGSEDVGIMFEKYADNSTNVAGGGGEYEVVEGFGWTNGVLIWAADTFGNRLKRPDCGNITAANVSPTEQRSLSRRAVELDPWDAVWTKKFGRRAEKQGL